MDHNHLLDLPQLSYAPPAAALPTPPMLLSSTATPRNTNLMAQSMQHAHMNNLPSDTAILASGQLDIQALEHATNLWEVIDQLECGDVQRIRDKYGPQEGRAAHSMWPKIKVTINRRERLYHQLMDPSEFGGNKDHFFEFFTVAHDVLAHGRKRKANRDDPEMVPYRLIVEAVPHRDKDIQEERQSPMYQDEAGSFSSQHWHERWGNVNDWEVWRMLKKEYYYKK